MQARRQINCYLSSTRNFATSQTKQKNLLRIFIVQISRNDLSFSTEKNVILWFISKLKSPKVAVILHYLIKIEICILRTFCFAIYLKN